MRLGIALLGAFLASILMLSNILPSYAGDPVPGIDISIEQIPGGTKNFGTNDSGIVTVSIPRFGDPDIMDAIEVSLRSNTDKNGLLLKLVETAPNSGIFKTGFSLTDTGRSSDTTLRVTQGDTITAEFMGVSTNGSVGVQEADAAKTGKEKDDRITAKNAKECKAEGGVWVVNSEGKGFCYKTLGKAKDAGVKEEGVKKTVDKEASERNDSIGGDMQTKNFNPTEVVVIKNIISKLKDALSQSNNPEALRLLSQLEEVWNQPLKAKAGKEQNDAATVGHKTVGELQAAKAKKEQQEADAAKEKKGLNAVNVKLAIKKLKDDLKSNPKALKLLKAVEVEISKVAKVSSDKAIDLANFNKAISKLKDELSRSNPEALKSVMEVTDTIEQMAENHNSSRSNIPVR